ncbi:MAG: GNAT family N-acetyltransferase [Caldimonas sp.]
MPSTADHPLPVLVPMTEVEYRAFVEAAVPDFAADKIASGEWTEDEALDLARRAFESLLPQGRETGGNHFFTVRDDEAEAVGVLWIATKERAGQRVAYVYNIGIEPEHRRRGHASRAFLALEEQARALDASGIALHVFGHNPGAQALYAKLGYRPTNINMFKPLGGAK